MNKLKINDSCIHQTIEVAGQTAAPNTGERDGYQESHLTGSKTQEQAAGVSAGEKNTRTLEETVASDTYSYSKQKTQPNAKTYLPQFLLPDISNTTINKNYKAY